MNWGLKNSADAGRYSKSERHEFGTEVGGSKDYFGSGGRRFEGWIGTAFRMALSIRLIGLAFILWTV